MLLNSYKIFVSHKKNFSSYVILKMYSYIYFRKLKGLEFVLSCFPQSTLVEKQSKFQRYNMKCRRKPDTTC